jgi:hypothetical protein
MWAPSGPNRHRIVVVAVLDPQAGVVGEQDVEVVGADRHGRTIAPQRGRLVNGRVAEWTSNWCRADDRSTRVRSDAWAVGNQGPRQQTRVGVTE